VIEIHSHVETPIYNIFTQNSFEPFLKWNVWSAR